MSFSYGKTETRNKPPRPLVADDIRSQGYGLPLSGTVVLVICIVYGIQMSCYLFHAAAQMWNFVIYLPFFIVDKVPEDDFHWECFLLLLEILRYCTAKVTCKPSTMFLATLIDDLSSKLSICVNDSKVSLHGTSSSLNA